MSGAPVCIGPDANIYEAAHAILTNKVSGVTVVDASGNMVGVLSELDCLRAIVTSVYNGADPGAGLVRDSMSANVETHSPDEDILSVAKSMVAHKRRRRPVVRDGVMIGQLTCRQILRAVTRMVDDRQA